MRSRMLLLLALTGPACAPTDMRPPPVCSGNTACPGGLPPGGGTNGTADGGVVAPADGGAGADGSVSVEGTVATVNQVPLRSDGLGTSPASGWRVEALDPVVPGDGVFTDAAGAFTLNGVVVSDGTYVLRAVPPVGAGSLATLNEFAPGGRPSVLAVTQATLDAAGASVPVSVDGARAHVVVQLVDASGALSGVSVQSLDGGLFTVAYDDATGVLRGTAIATGALGSAVLFNVDAPIEGRRLPIRLTRAARSSDYGIFVQSGHVTYVRVSPP